MNLLTIDEVAGLLKVSRRTIYTYIKMGKLSCVKLSNRTLRIKETDVMRLIAENTVIYEPNERTDAIAKKVLEKILKRG